jgi:quercetin dioxygenase-like cupin family protein
MRVVTTGTDEGGRSYVASIEERTGVPVDGLLEIFDAPLTLRPPTGRTGTFMDIAPAPGAAMWRVFDFGPGVVFEAHHTNSIDFDVVLEGEMTLELDQGELLLVPGDCVLLRGDSHTWKAGEQGCRMLFALLGTSG